jgi:hypothetical protein
MISQDIDWKHVHPSSPPAVRTHRTAANKVNAKDQQLFLTARVKRAPADINFYQATKKKLCITLLSGYF